jgi:chemotaxis protein histidine kinase CheA
MRRHFTLIPLFVLLMLSSCVTSKDAKEMAAVEKDFQALLLADHSANTNWEALKTSYENLQERLIPLSSSTDSSTKVKANSHLILVREKLKTVYEEVDYAKLMEAQQELASAASYEDAIQKGQELLNSFSNFAQKYPSSSKPVAEHRNRIQTQLESAYNEKYEYYQLSSSFKDRYTFAEASTAMDAIDAFLQKHPNSIMRANLSQRADGLREVKAKLWTQQDFKSISTLNTAIQEVNKLITEATASSTQEFMQSLITSLEAKKSEVFKVEVAEKTNELVNAMQTAARNSAKKAHPVCSNPNDPASLVDERRNVIGTRVEILRAYVIRTSGDFLCSSTYLVRVNVDGYLTGDENAGVTHGITSSRVVTDSRY